MTPLVSFHHIPCKLPHRLWFSLSATGTFCLAHMPLYCFCTIVRSTLPIISVPNHAQVFHRSLRLPVGRFVPVQFWRYLAEFELTSRPAFIISSSVALLIHLRDASNLTPVKFTLS